MKQTFGLPHPRRRRVAASLVGLSLAGGLLAACGGGSTKPELVWYINPDAGGQDAVAKACSTDQYTITTQVLPQDAGQQRIQLARRLAAQDPGIDLMSLDPPYTAEFANAGYLAKVPQEVKSDLESYGTFDSAMEAATWDGELVAFPFWSNTQILYYRKSFVDKAGINVNDQMTWDQVIDDAASNGGKLGVQANKYEGYSVWINALISGAGGSILTDTEKGADASVEIDSQAGKDAAKVIEKLSSSEAAPADLSVSNEGTAGATFASDQGSFMVNWTYIYHFYDDSDPAVAKDIGYARYPRTVADKPSAPPYGGIGIGVSEYSDQKDFALEAAACLVEPKQQATNAELTGNMPASTQGYDDPRIKKLYPADLIKLFEDSLNDAAPRTVTPYWSDVSGAILSEWHPSNSVNQDTPGQSASFIKEVLKGETIL